jgi:hypothetical protein
VLDDADQDAADDVDAGDDQAGDRVALHELAGAVHGPEEGRFLLQVLAALLGGVLVDQAGRQVGVDGHLLAGHGVQGEAGRDFRDPARTLGDDHEVHHHQDDEDDHPDDEVALHHQVAERLDDGAGAVRAFLAVAEDQACRGDVEAQAIEGRDQQDGRERGEFQRFADQHRRHQDQHRPGQRDRQQQVQQERRDRQDQQDDDAHDAQGQAHFAAQDPRPQRAGARHRAGPWAGRRQPFSASIPLNVLRA